MKNLKYILIGTYFGIVLTKSEAVSWIRIQEMFRFQSIHMYGIIFSAVITAALLTLLLKKMHIKTIKGLSLAIPQKEFNKGYLYGGIIFGLGWAVTGACPGPLYTLIGSGNTVIIVTLFSALLGTFAYSILQPKLPH